jgi:hypothetical protein
MNKQQSGIAIIPVVVPQQSPLESSLSEEPPELPYSQDILEHSSIRDRLRKYKDQNNMVSTD